jgi:uncharacterized membrane protein YkvA (DUF1232 family)
MVRTLLSVLVALVAVYVAAVAALWLYARRHPEVLSLRDAMRLLPDVLRLVRRLAVDPSLPRGLRIRLLLLLAYLISPVDLIPDVVPVLGYADDAVIVALVLRSVVRSAGPGPLARHWPGSPEGLPLVRRLAGLPSSASRRRPHDGRHEGGS